MADLCQCSTPDTRPKATLKDPGGESALTVCNNDRKTFCVARVDGGLLPQETGQRSCDYLLVVEDEGMAVLIELKGKNVSDGLKQLWDSLIRLSDKLKSCLVLSARLVPTENRHNQRQDHYDQMRRKFERKNCRLLTSKMPLVL